MAAGDQEVLKQIVTNLPDTIQNLNISIDGLTDTIADLGSQQAALEIEVMGPMTSASNDWGIALQAGSYPSYTRITSGTYGVDNITDWGIVNTAVPKSNPGYNQFKSNAVTSAGPAEDNDEAAQYNRQQQFPEVYTHIHDSLSSTKSYGIEDRATKLGTALTLQTGNEAKMTTVLKIYAKYDT